MSPRSARILWSGVLALPLVLALAVREVPRFIHASCEYYTTCAEIHLITEPNPIALDETSTLEALHAGCPCTWQIQSQPGGWGLVVGPDCTASLEPSYSYGNPGVITVQVTSPVGGSYCTDTISIQAGASTFRLEASTDGGWSWSRDSLTLKGKPGEVIDFSLRVTMTVTEDTTDGWSWSVAQQASTLIAAGGNLEILDVTTAGTHTATVRGGSPPYFEETQLRTDGATTTYGFIQGVMIDDEAAVEQGTVFGFVTAGACVRLTLPQQGTYQATYALTDDLGDGPPPIESMIVEHGESAKPAFRDFALTVQSHPYHTKTPSVCASNWITSGDGEPGPPPPPGGSGGGRGVQSPLTPPFSCGDGNADGQLNLSDAVFVLRSLFAGGQQPLVVDDFLSRTGQESCYDDGQELPECPNQGEPFFGQDAGYRAGYSLLDDLGQPRFIVDGENGTVTDRVTGLMWMKGVIDANQDGQITLADRMTPPEASQAADNLLYAGFDDWRLPEVPELLSIADFETPFVALDPLIFDWPPVGDARYWTKDWLTGIPGVVGCACGECTERFRYYVNFQWGHVNGQCEDTLVGYWVKACRDIAERSHASPLSPFFAYPFNYGDADASGTLNLTDGVYILLHLFRGGSDPCNVVTPVTTEVLPDTRWADNGDGTVSDLATGLVWVQAPSTAVFTWEEALREAEGSSFAGQSDRRLPNVVEIASLFLYRVDSGGLAPHPVSDRFIVTFPRDGELFWASTTMNNEPPKAWKANFDFAMVHNEFFDTWKTSEARVWPVRGGRGVP